MSVAAIHAICLGLVAADLAARMWRIQWFLRGLGHRISWRDAFTLNALGDAACALTPLRIGGEPARLGAMLRSRVPATAAFVAISIEVLAAWPVIILAAAALAWSYAPAWWATAGPQLAAAVREAWPWVIALVAFSGLAWWIAQRVASPLAHQLQRPVKRIRVYWRRMPWWPIVASIPLTLINLGARVAILPLLTLTLPHPPPIGATAVGSFALLYSQLILPTPSGAGAVEFGFLGGAAGDLGNRGAWLLAMWRFYTNGIGIILGVWLAVQIYGWPALQRALRRVST